MSREFRLDISIDLDRSLVRGNDLDVFQALLHTYAPTWSTGLKVWRNYEAKLPVDVTAAGDLARVLHAVTWTEAQRDRLFWQSREHPPYVVPGRVTGTEELRGSSPSLIAVVTLDDFVLRPIGQHWGWGNSLAIQICRARVERIPAAQWARDVFVAACTALAPVHAFANMSEEFDAKNISHEGGGTRAIGVDRSASLPGLYWLNFFGRPYRDLIGHDRLMTVPAFEVREMKDGVMIALDDDPRAWDTLEYQQRECEVIDHLGPQFFFDRTEPERSTVTPNFGVPKLTPPHGAQYLTAVKQGEAWSWQISSASC